MQFLLEEDGSAERVAHLFLTKLVQQRWDPEPLAEAVDGALERPPVAVAQRHPARQEWAGAE